MRSAASNEPSPAGHPNPADTAQANPEVIRAYLGTKRGEEKAA